MALAVGAPLLPIPENAAAGYAVSVGTYHPQRPLARPALLFHPTTLPKTEQKCDAYEQHFGNYVEGRSLGYEVPDPVIDYP